MLKMIEATGSARAIGRAQGESFREFIHERWNGEVATILANVEKNDPQHHERNWKIVDCLEQHLAKAHPDFLEEIRGIADGCGLNLQQTLMLSTYNALQFPEKIDTKLPDGCSAIAFADSPRGPMIFKTSDPFGSPEIDTPEKFSAKVKSENRPYFVMSATYTDFGEKPRKMLGVRYAGSLWCESGVNDAGLAFGAASLHPRLFPQNANTIPQHMIGMLALKKCESTAQVRATLARTPVFGKGYASSYTDLLGQCVGVEKTAGFTGFNPPQLGVAFMTNHIRSETLMPIALQQDPDFFKWSYFKNSANRVRRVEGSIARWRGISDFDALIADLTHSGACGDLVQNCTPQCQHWITNWASVVIAENRELRVTHGVPAERKFDSWTIA